MKKNDYPVIEVPASGKRGWYGGAYSMFFVYSKYKGNFILKGYMKEVEEYLKKNYTHYFYNRVVYTKNYGVHNFWSFWLDGVGIFEPDSRREKFQIRKYYDYHIDDEQEETLERNKLTFKRLPKRWIPEFDKF